MNKEMVPPSSGLDSTLPSGEQPSISQDSTSFNMYPNIRDDIREMLISFARNEVTTSRCTDEGHEQQRMMPNYRRQGQGLSTVRIQGLHSDVSVVKIAETDRFVVVELGRAPAPPACASAIPEALPPPQRYSGSSRNMRLGLRPPSGPLCAAEKP